MGLAFRWMPSLRDKREAERPGGGEEEQERRGVWACVGVITTGPRLSDASEFVDGKAGQGSGR